MKKGLGRGLNALLEQAAATENENAPDVLSGQLALNVGVMHIDIRKIEPGKHQPRQFFEEESLRELAESIKSFGVIQPLLVRDCGDHYAIIAGERRFRAARIARLATLPVIVKDYTEAETLQAALIENIQRQDLTPVEEANCFKKLMDDYLLSHDDIVEKTGKNKHAVVGLLRLLELDERVLAYAEGGRVTPSHAQVLLAIRDGDLQYECARRVAENNLSVRATENLVAAVLKKPDEAEIKNESVNSQEEDEIYLAYRKAEAELKNLLGSKVSIRDGKKKGRIEIEYYSAEELDRLLCLFKRLN